MIIHVIFCHIRYSVRFHSTSNFTIHFLRISFPRFTRFFKHHSIANSCRICFKFEREIHKTQLHGMMRAFCCIYFIISVPCVGIRHLEGKKCDFCAFPHNIFQYHLFLKPFHHPMLYHVVNVVCKFHIIMMHASGNIMFERSIYLLRWWPCCAIICVIYAKKWCLK